MPPKPDSATLAVRVNPRSSRNKIHVQADGSLKIWVTDPPVEGEANKAVCELLAKRLRIAKSRVCVFSGDASRDKKLSVEGMTVAEVLALLRANP